MPDPDILVTPPGPALSATVENIQSEAPASDSTAPATELETAEKPPSQPSGEEPPQGESGEPKDAPAPGRSRKATITDRFRLERDEARAQLRQALDALALTQARAQPPPQTQQQPAQIQGEAPKPVRADYEDPDAYTDAVATWTARREVSRALQTMAQTNVQMRQAQAIHERVNGYREKVQAAREKYVDFAEVAEAPDLPINDLMAQAIMRSEHGPEIQYHLGKNPDEARRIADLSARDPYAAVLALGALEARLSTGSKPVVSKAPAPIRSKVGAKETVSTDPYQKPMDEFAAHWHEREKAIRDRGKRR